MKKCPNSYKKMCEEPCYSCGKCWNSKPICIRCDKVHTYFTSRCKYTKEQIDTRRKQYSKTYNKALIIGIILVSLFVLINCISGVHFIIHAIIFRNLGLGDMFIWYFKTYWWLLILDFIISLKIKK